MPRDDITGEPRYDLFLSYNSGDHSFVEAIAHRLRDAGLEPFLDRWYLTPGARWRPKLEEILTSSKAVAICVGAGQMGSWQQREADVAFDLQSKSPDFPVIPVLLPGSEPPLGFLGQLMWVDFRSQLLDQAIPILTKAARGEPPGPDLQRRLESVRASICPYRGLLYFREEDAPLFFGREKDVGTLCDAIRQLSFVAVVGASGSGKSSVVRAGLVPRLRSDRSASWEIVTLVPTDQPLKAMAEALVPLLEPTMSEVDRLVEVGKLAEHFRSETVSFADVLRRICAKQSGTDRVLVVVDQFEELFTLTHDDVARRRFIDELLAVGSCSESKLSVVLTLRGDFVGRTLAYRPLSDRLQGAQINIGPMTREELECAILKPAEETQLEFEPGLVRRILNDVGDEPGNLPLLEFLLRELWEKRRGRMLLNESYDATGGLQGAVAGKADELFKSLSSAEQKILQRIFLRIVRPSAESGPDTRRRAAFTELPAEGKELVAKLTGERLLVTNQSASGLEQTVEVAHEALISNWNTLRAWVNEDREFLLWRDRLGPLVAEWERALESDEAVLRGPLLTEAQKWFDRRRQDLSDQEQKFISASREEREKLAREDRERQERELETAQQLAQAQALRAEEAKRADRAKTTATSNAANALTASAIGRMDRGESFAALHELAAAIHEIRDQAAQQVPNRLRLRFAQQIVPQLVMILPHEVSVASARLSNDGGKVVTTDWEGKVRLWDTAVLASGEINPPKLLEDGPNHDPPFEARFSDDGRVLITAAAEKILQVWNTAQMTQISTIAVSDFPYHSDLSFDGSKLVTAGVLPKSADVWETRSGKHLFTLSVANLAQDREVWIQAVQFDHDGRYIATQTSSGLTVIWDAQSGEQKSVVKDDSQVFWAAFRPNAHQIATSTNDGGVTLWDFESGQRIQNFSGFAELVNFTTFDRTGKRLLGLSQSDNPRLWIPESERPNSAVVLGVRARASRNPGDGFPTRGAFSQDGSGLLTWQANTVTFWDVLTGRPIWTIQGHVGGELTGHVTDASISSDARFVVTASGDKTVRVWRVPQPFQSCIETYDVEAIRKAADSFSDQLIGKHVSWRSKDGKPASADCIEAAKSLRAAGEQSREGRTSPDGMLEIVVGEDDMSLDVVEVKTRKVISSLKGHQNVIHGAHFDQSGNLIASYSSGDNTARVWSRAKSGRFSRAGVFQQDDVRSAAFNQSGTLLATATFADNSVAVWDISARALVARLVGSTGPVSFCKFDTQGRLVTAFSNGDQRHADYSTGHTTYIHLIPDDRTIAIWDTAPIDIDVDLLRTWVEVYTGTIWAPNLPGGVDGLTEAEWNERRTVLSAGH